MAKEQGHGTSSLGANDNDQSPAADSSRECLTSEPKPPFSASSSHSTPVQAETTTEAIPTSAGPPVQETSDVELGRIGQPLDPESDADVEEPYFAVPGGPGIVQRNEEDGNDPNAFFHPATKEPQRILWLPRDELGLCEAEIEVNVSAGIQSTHRYAILNAKVTSLLCVLSLADPVPIVGEGADIWTATGHFVMSI